MRLVLQGWKAKYKPGQKTENESESAEKTKDTAETHFNYSFF